MMGRSPQCYIPSFVEISLLVPEKTTFEGFLLYTDGVAIIVMSPASCHQIFISLYKKAFRQNLVQNGTVVSEKIRFEFDFFCMNMTLGQGQEMTLTFNTHISSLTLLVVCIYQLSGHRLR